MAGNRPYETLYPGRRRERDGEKGAEEERGEALYIPWVHLPGRAAVDVFSPSPSLEPETPVCTQERRRKPGAVSGHATLQVLLHWSGVRWDRLGDGGRGARPMTRLPPCNGAFQNRSHALSGPMRGCRASVSAVRISALGTPRGVWARAHAPLRRCRPSPTVLPSAVGQTFPPLSPSHPAKSGAQPGPDRQKSLLVSDRASSTAPTTPPGPCTVFFFSPAHRFRQGPDDRKTWRSVSADQETRLLLHANEGPIAGIPTA